jgi:hypothetical protein
MEDKRVVGTFPFYWHGHGHRNVDGSITGGAAIDLLHTKLSVTSWLLLVWLAPRVTHRVHHPRPTKAVNSSSPSAPVLTSRSRPPGRGATGATARAAQPTS